MNYLDILFGIPLLWFAYKGFNKGLIVEITSLIALIAGIWLAVHFSWFVGDYLEGMLEIKHQYISLTSFTITFLGVVIVVNMVGKLVTKLVKSIAMGFPNKLAGAVFGAAKVAFIISVVLYMFARLDSGMKIIPEDMREGSLLFQPIAKIAPVVIPKLEAEQQRLREQKPETRE